MSNPDYNMDLYHWQDANVEIPPKDMENRDLGFVLEAAGDIFRELTGRIHPDGGYIGEKFGRIERTLAHPADRAEVFAALSDADQDRVEELQQKWFSIKGLSDRLTAVRNLNIALSDQNEAGVRFNLRRFKEEWMAEGPTMMSCVHEGHETPHKRVGKGHRGISHWRCTICGETRTSVTPSRRPAGHEVHVRGHRRQAP